MKTWFCKTAGVEPQRAQDLLDLAVDNGANACEGISRDKHIYPCRLELDEWKFFGVDDYNNTALYNGTRAFGKDAIELTIDEVEHFIKTGEKLVKNDQRICIDCTDFSDEKKKRVQDAFFKLGYKWLGNGACYRYLEKSFYSNSLNNGVYEGELMWGDKLSKIEKTYQHTYEQLMEKAGMAVDEEPTKPADEQYVYDINDFDIENALTTVKEEFKYTGATDRAVKDYLTRAIQAAIPKVRAWDGVEPLAVGHRVRMRYGVTTIMLHKDADDLWVTRDTNGVNSPTELRPNNNCFPIKPPVQKIDHSSLVGSGIDVITVGDEEIVTNVDDVTHIKSIRMNHTLALKGHQLKRIPKGYDVDVLNGNGEYYCKLHELEQIHDKKVYAVNVIGTLDNWEL